MAVCKILAALRQAEKKGQSDSQYLCSGTCGSEWGCRFTSLCGDWSGSTEMYWDKFLKVVLFLVLLVLVSLKIWSFLLESTHVLLVAPVRVITRGIFTRVQAVTSSSSAVSNSTRGTGIPPQICS